MRLIGKALATLLLGVQALPSPAAAAVNAPAPLPVLERVTVMASPREIPDFTLTDHEGNARAFASLLGTPLLVFFGFTHCPDVCPAVLTRLKLLHESGDAALRSARVVMVSVDGERDTPAVLNKYLASFSPDFIGLTGEPRAVSDIAARFAAVAFKEKPDQAGNYGFFHSSQVFVLDKRGRLRASFADASVENMAAVTLRLLAEEDVRK
jgi:protein SCO1/2